MQHHTTHYIDGRWVEAADAEAGFYVHDSSTGEAFARVPAGTAAEAATAAAAARRAFDGWAATPPAERAAALERVAAALEARSEAIATTITREVGMPLKMARAVQVGTPIWHWRNFAQVARDFEWERVVGHSRVLREPVGVVGCITPWNFPLNQITLKVAAALAAGCTVVLKPSEVAPLNAIALAEAIHEAGLPPGVFNLVHGAGPVVGEVLASHPDIDMVSFTGSTRAGRRVAELAAHTVKRVALELGGKSASVVLSDADLAAAIKGTVAGCLLNSGQTCSALTRLVLPASQLEAAKPLLQHALDGLAVGASLDAATKLGPLVSAPQQERVRAHIARGAEEGATVLAEGRAPDGPGYFVAPRVLHVQPGDTLAHEEIFGPVLVVITYPDGDEDAAVRIANDSIYGLGGAVWAGSDERAMAVARRIRTGQVAINGGAFNSQAPFGGYKQSGNGRENGVYGLEEFLEYKALQFRSAPAAA